MTFKGIKLRPIELEDLSVLQKLFNDPEINKDTTGWELPVSMDHQNAWFSTLKDKKNEFRCMIEDGDGETVGTISISQIDYRNRTVSLNGAKVLTEYQNKGYGIYAFIAMLNIIFDQMDFYCVEIQHLSKHSTTKHIMEKLCFVHEGTLRNRVYKNGKRHDVLVWSMNSEEYKAARQNNRFFQE